ncbi:predicted protein [Verticillium alfalfae VaMs.102]|uniref:Predicted protein n=1 Tax=Verticillium alfalfae (strain VaMs.102 / ATCC MYA-4576 / FGSC 10136) TaxID=526221 RepID=C9S6Y8_VERA1|nr:predicted protein [Verticillium alfalfae VaMs.102]EEY14599.1 predicted protein [Verticillium alfalfae VaMs.102]
MTAVDNGGCEEELPGHLGPSNAGRDSPGCTEILGVQHRLVEEDIQLCCEIGLDDKEEKLLGGDVKEGVAEDCIGRIVPDVGANQIRVPGNGGHNGNRDDKAQFCRVDAC